MQQNIEHFVESYRQLQDRWSEQPDWLSDLRGGALQVFSEAGFPTTRQEEWKYTNVAPLTKISFGSAAGDSEAVHGIERAKQAIASYTIDGCSTLVMVDGTVVPELSSMGELAGGAQVKTLREALVSEASGLREAVVRQASFEGYAFAALNTALMQDGAYIFVPDGAVIEQPIHLLSVSTAGAQPLATHLRYVIMAGPNSRVTAIESYVGLAGEPHFTNSVTQVQVAPGAAVDHYKVQREQPNAYHIARLQVRQAESCTFRSHAFSLGSALARNDINVTLEAQGSECTLNGLFLVDGERHVDNHTTIDHTQPNCNSHQLYKGVLDGHAQGVFNGKIFVRSGAQKTDAKQSNNNLLLSPDATINAKPQLEIFADDVKCTHGATIGHLDEDAMFYLRARGLDQDLARSLLTLAFASEVTDQVRHAPLKDALSNAVAAMLPAADSARSD